MDMSCAIVIDSKLNCGYYVQIANDDYSSPKFNQAFEDETPLSAQDLIQEDHYQIFRTLDEVCKVREDLTKETK